MQPKSYELDHNEVALYNRAICYVGIGKIQDAVKDLELFLKISKSPVEKAKAEKALKIIRVSLE